MIGVLRSIFLGSTHDILATHNLISSNCSFYHWLCNHGTRVDSGPPNFSHRIIFGCPDKRRSLVNPSTLYRRHAASGKLTAPSMRSFGLRSVCRFGDRPTLLRRMGLLAVVFPAVSETGAIRSIAEARCFITHIALVGAGFYLVFGCRYHPKTKSILRIYAVLVTPLNLYLDTNYFYTLSAPVEVHFVQDFPHWFLLGAASATFLATFGLLYIPFHWKQLDD